MPVEDYLHYRGRLWSMPRKDRTRAIARVLERCWLRDVSLRRIGTLSKGYKQRVGLASALLHDPPALVLDEPTNGLDPTQVHETRSLVRELAADRTVLLSSHILTEVEKLCDRVVIIAGGVVKADGSPSELAAATGLGGVQLAAFALEEDKSSAHALAAVIAAMEGVTRVSQQWGQTPGGHVQPGQAQAGQAHPRSVWTCFVQSAGADTQALREQIALAALAHRVPLHLVREQRATLEQVFAHATDSAGASAANTAPTSEPARPALAPPASLPHAASWDAARREVALSEQQLRLRARLDAAASAEQSQPPATLDGPRAGGTP
jgi:ABC-type multidrug transport system ATPase subunit